MDYQDREKAAGLSPIPKALYPLLWLGFFLRTFRAGAFNHWREERLHLAINQFPPAEQWFSPFLRLFIGIRFFLWTGRTQRWFLNLFTELCKEEGFTTFRRVARVGWVKIEPGFVHIQILENIKGIEGWRTEVTLNESWPGKVYVHTRYLGDDWKLAYRVNWDIRDLSFMPILEELWRQLERTKQLRHVIPIRKNLELTKD